VFEIVSHATVSGFGGGGGGKVSHARSGVTCSKVRVSEIASLCIALHFKVKSHRIISRLQVPMSDVKSHRFASLCLALLCLCLCVSIALLCYALLCFALLCFASLCCILSLSSIWKDRSGFSRKIVCHELAYHILSCGRSTLVLKVNRSYSYTLGQALWHSWFCSTAVFATQLLLRQSWCCRTRAFGTSQTPDL
jgi:hypothetical protein